MSQGREKSKPYPLGRRGQLLRILFSFDRAGSMAYEMAVIINWIGLEILLATGARGLCN
jgi:hypothetical protein